MGRMKHESGMLSGTMRVLGMMVILTGVSASVAQAGTAPNGVAIDTVALGAGDRSISTDDLCPCHGPITGGSWESPQAYRECSVKAAAKLLRARLISRADARARVRASRASRCGAPAGELADANVRICIAAPEGALGCPIVAGAHADTCGECKAALEDELVTCATLAGNAGNVCGRASAKTLAGGRRILDVRTGIDCGSCEAKLGTDRPEGVTCLAGACGPIF